MPLPETIEKTYLPDDQVDATTLNAMQHAIVANHDRIDAQSAPELQWLVGKTLGDVSFAPDGTATIDGQARVFLDVRQAPIQEIRVRCRVDPGGLTIQSLDGTTELASATHTSDGTTWGWIVIPLGGLTPGSASKLTLLLHSGQSQQMIDCFAVIYR